MTTAIIDSGGANITSVQFALQRLGVDAVFTADRNLIRAADRVILPGVGAARAAMQRLQELGLVEFIRGLTQPVLGICLGMQLLSSTGDEGGHCAGLDLVPGHVQQFDAKLVQRIPHVGWNQVALSPHPVLRKTKSGVDFYFVHSFHFVCADSRHSLGRTDCGQEFTSIVGRGNVLGFQFHPEKSQSNGLGLLERFCDWDGTC
jgi:glutamine amidotransferase